MQQKLANGSLATHLEKIVDLIVVGGDVRWVKSKVGLINFILEVDLFYLVIDLMRVLGFIPDDITEILHS